MSARYRLPRRPRANSSVIPGTTIRRSYVAPKSLDTPTLGDIVAWASYQWDVVGTNALSPPDEAGYQPLSLMLERIERPLGRKKIIREYADSRDVVLLARQVLLPGTPPHRPQTVRSTVASRSGQRPGLRHANWATAEEYALAVGQAQPSSSPQRRAQPERYFTDRVKRYARRGGWLVYHPLRSQGSDAGFLDLTLLRAPRLVVAELKVPPNTKPSDWQEVWLAGWRTLAVLAGPHLSLEVYLWQPDDMPLIEEILGMSERRARHQTPEERFLFRMAELQAERRRVILTALRQYRIARRWMLASTCGSVMLLAASVVRLAYDDLFWGLAGIVAGVLLLLYARWQSRRIRAAQLEAYALLEGDD